MKKKLIAILMLVLISSNSFSLFSSGSGGSSSYWQMKTYFESVAINAQTLKSMNTKIQQINHMIEQAKKMPETYFQNNMKQYTEILNTISQIQNNTKSVLRDAKKAELWFKDVYTDVNNKNYQNLLDRFTSSIDNLSYDAMRTSGLASSATKKNNINMKNLLQQAKNSNNPVQLLEVTSNMISNLGNQLSTITEVLASDSRLKALEKAEEAQERKLARERHEYTKKSLNNTIKKLENEKKTGK